MFGSSPPPPGTVLCYAYLWARQADAGRDEGEKDRPAALVLSRMPDQGPCVVLPITHTPPDRAADAIEIPRSERERLGLDGERSWIVLSEINVFNWPGPDLRPVPSRDPATVMYGRLSRGLFARLVAAVKDRLRDRPPRQVARE